MLGGSVVLAVVGLGLRAATLAVAVAALAAPALLACLSESPAADDAVWGVHGDMVAVYKLTGSQDTNLNRLLYISVYSPKFSGGCAPWTPLGCSALRAEHVATTGTPPLPLAVPPLT